MILTFHIIRLQRTLSGPQLNRTATDYYTAIRLLVHWPLMGGLLHLVQRGGAWAGCGPTQSPPRCTKCNNPPINGQCTNFIVFDVALQLPVGSKGLTSVSWCLPSSGTASDVAGNFSVTII